MVRNLTTLNTAYNYFQTLPLGLLPASIIVWLYADFKN